jgi:hypothetical protein
VAPGQVGWPTFYLTFAGIHFGADTAADGDINAQVLRYESVLCDPLADVIQIHLRGHGRCLSLPLSLVEPKFPAAMLGRRE